MRLLITLLVAALGAPSFAAARDPRDLAQCLALLWNVRRPAREAVGERVIADRTFRGVVDVRRALRDMDATIADVDRVVERVLYGKHNPPNERDLVWQARAGGGLLVAALALWSVLPPFWDVPATSWLAPTYVGVMGSSFLVQPTLRAFGRGRPDVTAERRAFAEFARAVTTDPDAYVGDSLAFEVTHRVSRELAEVLTSGEGPVPRTDFTRRPRRHDPVLTVDLRYTRDQAGRPSLNVSARLQPQR